MAETIENKSVHKLSYSNLEVDKKFDTIAADDNDTYTDGSDTTRPRYRKLTLGDSNPVRSSGNNTYKTALKHGEGTEVYSPNSTAVGVDSVAGGRYFTFHGTVENGGYTPKLWAVTANGATRYNGLKTISNDVPPKDYTFDASEYYVVLTLDTDPAVDAADAYLKYYTKTTDPISKHLTTIASLVKDKEYPTTADAFAALIEKEALAQMPLYVSIKSSWNIDFAGYLCGMYGKFEDNTNADYCESKNIISNKLKSNWAYTVSGWNDQYQLLIKLVDSSAEYASKYLLGSYNSKGEFEPIGITTGQLWFPNHPEWGNMMFSGSSHAEGATTFATVASHSEGDRTFAAGKNSHAEGLVTRAGYCAHAEGKFTRATHNHAHAEGYSTTANASSAHAEGANTRASGSNAHTEGYKTTAKGANSHAEGDSTTASGAHSHAEGYSTISNGVGSHAGGNNSTAETKYSFAHGNTVKTDRDYQTVVGEYNKPAENALFVVGNGNDNTNRSNAFEVHKDGNLFFKSLSVGQTNNVTNIKAFSVFENSKSGAQEHPFYQLQTWGQSNSVTQAFNTLLGLKQDSRFFNYGQTNTDSDDSATRAYYYYKTDTTTNTKTKVASALTLIMDATTNSTTFNANTTKLTIRPWDKDLGAIFTDSNANGNNEEKYNLDKIAIQAELSETIFDKDLNKQITYEEAFVNAVKTICSKRAILVVKTDIKERTDEGEEHVVYAAGTTWDLGLVKSINLKDCSKAQINVTKGVTLAYKTESNSDEYALIFVDNEDKGTVNVTRGTTLGYGLKSYNPHETVVGTFNEPKGGLLFSVGCGTSDTDRKNALEVYNDGTVCHNADTKIS